ncbi:MAG: hypothetical protein IAG10_20600 [Planctomycetaceae bacterium]|nr:hypothetical protein [Planctomycetaceae bacterium]
MFLRSTRWTASVLALGMSAATVVAQPPAGPTNAPPVANSLIAPPSAYPQEGVNYSFDEGGNFYDELDLSPQFRFQADWVFYTRQNRAKSLPVISGDESFTSKGADFNYNSGYRLTLGFMNDDFEFEGSYFELNGLGSSSSGSLTNAVVFDGEGGFLASSLATQATFGAVPNFLESSTFFAPINAAANFSVAPNAEDTELEFLDPGAQYVVRYDTQLQDFDFNLKGRRQPGRLLRFGVGYRNIQFNESGLVALRGTFNTIDNDPLVPDASDGLSNTALTDTVTGGGLTLASGAGGFLENTLPTLPDQLVFSSSTRAANQLNGVQATMDATFLESEYFQLGGYAKAGVYHNRARGSVSEVYQALNNVQSRYTRNLNDSQDRIAFAGNLGITGTVFLRDNLRLFGGYELMYLSGVALAPDQAGGIRTDISNVTSLDLQSHGQALFHGGRVGIEILFP